MLRNGDEMRCFWSEQFFEIKRTAALRARQAGAESDVMRRVDERSTPLPPKGVCQTSHQSGVAGVTMNQVVMIRLKMRVDLPQGKAIATTRPAMAHGDFLRDNISAVK